jgi:hypothetical protein
LISGRDPLGGFYLSGGKAYRFIKREAWPSFEASLPLQGELAERGLWLPLRLPPAKEDESSYHCEVPLLPLVLYPYEWPFSLWKEAALTTLTILQEALREGFWLRDATPFNLTLYHGRMCHFDQLSLEPYPEGSPWPAYVEFIRTFLAPLLLMSYKDRRLGKLIQLYREGLFLDLVWKFLRMRGRWSGLGLLHLSPHKLPRLSASLGGRGGLSMKKLLTLVESLYVGVESLKLWYASSPWEGYAGAFCSYPHLRSQSCTQLTFNFSPLVSGRPYLCLMIWSYTISHYKLSFWAAASAQRALAAAVRPRPPAGRARPSPLHIKKALASKWYYVDSDVWGLIWQGLLAADATLEPLL